MLLPLEGKAKGKPTLWQNRSHTQLEESESETYRRERNRGQEAAKI